MALTPVTLTVSTWHLKTYGPNRMNRKQTAKMLSKYLNYYFWRVRIFQTVILILQDVLDFGCRIPHTGYAIFRIERKDDQKIAQKCPWHPLANRFEIHSFFYARFSRFTIGTCRTRRITLRAPRKITTDHDMRPIQLIYKLLMLNSLSDNLQSCSLNSFFNQGMVLASFHSKGTSPSCSDMVNTCVTSIQICSTVSFSIFL